LNLLHNGSIGGVIGLFGVEGVGGGGVGGATTQVDPLKINPG
jgi:hypothetical protein